MTGNGTTVSGMIDAIIDRIIQAEGATFTNDPNDSGHATKYGVTQQNLAEYSGHAVTVDDVRNLTLDIARAVHRELKVTRPHFSKLIPLSQKIAAEVIDTAVNAGPSRATMILQRCLNALNRNEKDYRDVVADGNCGPATINALAAFLKLRGTEGEIVLWCALNCLQGEFYISLAERRPKDENFVYGWLLNRVTIHA